MTPSTKPVTRKTSAYVRDKGLRPLVVTITHGMLELRPLGCRTTEVVDLGAIWQGAVKARIFAAKKARKAARKKS